MMRICCDVGCIVKSFQLFTVSHSPTVFSPVCTGLKLYCAYYVFSVHSPILYLSDQRANIVSNPLPHLLPDSEAQLELNLQWRRKSKVYLNLHSDCRLLWPYRILFVWTIHIAWYPGWSWTRRSRRREWSCRSPPTSTGQCWIGKTD